MAFAAPVALALGGIGAGLSAFGAVEGGLAQSATANYQAEVARNNQIIANQNAELASAAGQKQAYNQALKGAAIQGKIKAGQAASGIDVNTGSALDVQKSQEQTSETDTENILYNAELQNYGYRTQAASYGAQANLDQAEAEQEPIGADIGAAGSLLSNASGLGFNWQKANQTTPQTPTIP